MTIKELKNMFEGYEEYVEILSSNKLLVHDFNGFDEDWEENIIELPYIVEERLNMCKLMGVNIEYESADI